jgi:hypothetical protein
MHFSKIITKKTIILKIYLKGTSDGHVAMKSSSQIWTLIQNAVAQGELKIELPVPVTGGFAVVNITATDAVQLVDNTNFGASNIYMLF